MKIPDIFDQLPTDDVVGRVFGEPFQTGDGTTLIPAARIRGGARFGDGLTATPLGAFVIRGDKTSWVGAVDVNRIALIGVITGLLAAVIGSLAVLRRPPWPDLRGSLRQGL
ncbi:hypothetical protein [Mycobacterium noviomagense]|uniref:Sporulation protein n=1 Tax=Mycobacterium noviomagense TaxID=459858 RepID=A0A7I7PDP2_9MYCO|nr:hypothetical protein [Mycobacterium noviomagense]ORB11419.1 hypothetical protein BST37_19450 [Mycobacterium noviomagense]BBY06737.1 hypothetical protein MNVI_20550 [Mycobacterium noviomagense]